VHRLLRDDEVVRDEILRRFGSGVLDDEGRVDRAAVARIVFREREELAWLEALLHPRVFEEYESWRRALERSPAPPALAVMEVPLLYETGGEARFDAVVVITASPEVRARRGALPEDDRAARLLADDEKVRRADYAFVNDGTRAELESFVADVVGELSASVPA
jgi:dephospho-CoA kinase